MTDSDFDLHDSIERDRIPQLMDLYAGEWWTAHRSAKDVGRMLDSTDLVFALIERSRDRLVGFARVLTDDSYLAVILDVIVAKDLRHRGVGAMLMNAIVSHPRLATVKTLELVCQPELVAFYRRWGFSDRVGRSTLMRRTSDPLLVKS